MPSVRWRIAATENGAALVSGSAPVVSGSWSQALTIPSGIADGATWWLGRSGLDDAGNAETWKWTSHFVAAVQAVAGFPQALGTLSAKPSWTAAFKSMFGTSHDPVTATGSASWPTPTRTVQFDSLPVADDATLKVTGTGMTDTERRWMGYFGNHVGYSGTRQAGDRLVMTEDATYVTAARNLDMPRFTADFELYAPGVTIQHTHANSSTGLMENHAIRLLGDRQSLPSDGSVTDAQAQANSARRIFIHGSKTKPLKLETIGAVGRTGLNQQGNTMLLVDPFAHDIIVEDVHGIAARAAGFFGYTGRRVWFNRCESIETQADAFHAANGCEDFLYTDCVSIRSGDDGGAPVRYPGEAATSSSKRIAYIRHRVLGTGHGRGMVSICNSDIYYDQCYIEGSAAAGFLWDREEGSSSNPVGMANNLAQRLHIKGCNWSEQDHGSVFLRNPSTHAEVYGRMESVLIEDAMPNRQVVRGIGDSGAVLSIVCKDFKAVGGPGNSTWFGGNNLTGITFDPAVLRQETAGADTTPPTLAWLAPGRKATITGTLTGRPQKNSNGTMVDDLGNTGAYRNTMLAFYAGHVLGLTSAGVEVRLGDTVIGTVPKSSLDAAGRGYLLNIDTTPFRNGAGYLSIRAVSSSNKTSTVLYRPVTVNNASPGTQAIIPTTYSGTMRVTGAPADTVLPPATIPPSSSASPSTTAAMLMHVDPSTSSVAEASRMTDLTDRVTGKAFTWATDSERAIVRTLSSGRKVAEFLNGRALLEGSGVAAQSAMTVTLVMSQRNLVTALRSGYVSATPANADDFEKTSGQWAIGGPSASGETTWSSLTVSGAPQSSGNYTGFSRTLDTYAVVQVAMSTDGTPPAVYVDGTALTTSATNPTTSGTLQLDRILLGARWYGAPSSFGPKDGQQYRLAAFMVHAGRLSAADRNAIRSWAATNIGTPSV